MKLRQIKGIGDLVNLHKILLSVQIKIHVKEVSKMAKLHPIQATVLMVIQVYFVKAAKKDGLGIKKINVLNVQIIYFMIFNLWLLLYLLQ
jgi:hypothetical protein